MEINGNEFYLAGIAVLGQNPHVNIKIIL